MGREVSLKSIASPRNHETATSAYVAIDDNRQPQQPQQPQPQQQRQDQQQHQDQQQQYRPLRRPSQTESTPLTEEEIGHIRWFLQSKYRHEISSSTLQTARSNDTLDSNYDEYTGTTHAWTVFADDPAKRATTCDRMVGTSIILFQLFTYYVFAKEAIRDYKSSAVPVQISHRLCLASGEAPEANFTCEAMITNNFDNIVAFYMLGVFLSADFLQAARTIKETSFATIPWCFALLAGLEVVCAFFAATIAISYNLHIGELTDAIEVGVGLLFIRELSAKAYAGLTHKKRKQYRQFFSVVFLVVLIGFILDPMYERMFIPS